MAINASVLERAFIGLLALSMGLTFWGKSIVGIGLAIALIPAIILIIRHRSYSSITKMLFSREVIMLAAVMACWLYSAFQGVDPDKSVHQWLEIFGITVGGIILFSALASIRGFCLIHFSRIATAVAGIAAATLLASPMLGEYGGGWGSSYGSVLVVLLPFSIYVLAQGGRSAWIWWGLVLLMIAAIFASGGRTAWVALIFVVPLFLALYPWGETIHKQYIKLGLLLVVIAGGVLGFASYSAYQGTDLVMARTIHVDPARPASGRLIVWENTVGLIKERPVWGYGMKSASQLEIDNGYGAVLHPHNIVLEIWLETGLAGLLAFTAFILLIVARFAAAYARYKGKDPILRQKGMIIFLSFLSYGLCAMALTSIFHAWWLLYLVALLAILHSHTLRLERVHRGEV